MTKLGCPQATPVRSFGSQELQRLQRPQTAANRSLAVEVATAVVGVKQTYALAGRMTAQGHNRALSMGRVIVCNAPVS